MNTDLAYDFRVKYRFFNQEEGGRKNPPYQGYRSDFKYVKQEKENQAFMIWPFFEDEEGNFLPEDETSVSQKGIASMRILNPKMRPYHQQRIKVGVKGFFVEGPRKVAECEVIEVLGLFTNPIS